MSNQTTKVRSFPVSVVEFGSLPFLPLAARAALHQKRNQDDSCQEPSNAAEKDNQVPHLFPWRAGKLMLLISNV
jgi:hypothetical protein